MTHEEKTPMRPMGASNVVEIEIRPDTAATAGSSSAAAGTSAATGDKVMVTGGGESHLRGGDTTDAGLKTYARLKNREGVEVESISGSKITDAGLKELRDFRNLRALNLTCAAGVTDAGAKELKGCTGLRELHLVNTGVSDAGLAELRGLDTLEFLYLSGPRITDAGLKVLRDFKSLREVCLLGVSFTDAGLKDLKDLKDLRALHLRSDRITNASLRELKGLTSLQVLSLTDTNITDAGLKELKGLGALRELNLRYTKVTDAGLREVAEIKALQVLDLTYTNVTDAGLKALEGLKGLQELRCVGAAVTDAGVERLRKALPQVQITSGEGAGARPTLEPSAKSGEPNSGASPAAAKPAPELSAPDEALRQLATIVELEERILAGVQERFKVGRVLAEDVARQQLKVTDAKVRLAERKAKLIAQGKEPRGAGDQAPVLLTQAALQDEIRRLLAENVAQEEELLAQVRQRYNVGKTTSEDVEKQQVRVAEAKVRLAERMKATTVPSEKPAGAASKTSGAPSDGWGEAFESVQCRLRADRIGWKCGEIPTFKADVRNQGTREVQVHMIQEISWELEVDGEWYVWKRGAPWVGWQTLTHGMHADGIAFKLEDNWQRKSDRSLLILKAGRHVVRVGLPIPPVVDASEPPVPRDMMECAVSNAVEIEISPGETKPAATPILKIRSADGAAVADVRNGAVRVRMGDKTLEAATIIISLDSGAGGSRKGIVLGVRDGAVRLSAEGKEVLGAKITIHPDGRTEISSPEAADSSQKGSAPSGAGAVRPEEPGRAEPRSALPAGDGGTRAGRQVFPLTYREADETDGIVRGNTFHHCLPGRPAEAKAVPADLSGQALYFLLPIGGRKVLAVLDPSPTPRLLVDVAGTGDLSAASPLFAKPWGPTHQFGPVAIPVDGQAGRVARVRFLSSLGKDDKDIAVAPAGYMAGEVNLDGQPYRLALVDHSLSGRYDNVLRGEGTPESARGETYLAIDLNRNGWLEPPGTDASETFDLLPALHVRNAYYSVQVAPDGSSITLTDTKPNFGTLDTGCADLGLALVGEHGLHKLSGSGGKWQIPAGWHAATGATLNRSDGAGTPWSLHGVSSWGRLARFDIRTGETLSLRAGPPLTVKVHASGLQPNGMIHFALALVGQAGEDYNAAARKGGVPQPPRFSVFDESGRTLGSGVFNPGTERTYSWCWWRVPAGFRGKYRVEVDGDWGSFEIARSEPEWFSAR
jgi:hypothetical protein